MPTRRQLLGSAGAAVASSLAGCVASPRASRTVDLDPLASTPLDEFAATQFRLGLRNRGYVDATVPDRVRVDWSLSANRGDHTAAKATPVAVGDRGDRGDRGDQDDRGDRGDPDVLVADDAGRLRRVGPGKEVRWTATVVAGAKGFHGTPAVANGTAYVGAYDGACYAFDATTGERLWRTQLGQAIGASPTYYNGLCYVAVEHPDPSGSVVALDAATGDVRWIDRRPTDRPHSTVALARNAGRLVVGANDGICYAWTFPGFERAWTFETGGPIKGPVAVAGGLAVFGSWDGRVYGVRLDDGGEAWSFAAGADVMGGAAVDPGGTVYVGSHDGLLYALDGTDGRELWRFDAGGALIGSVTATRNRVLVGSYDRRLYAVDAATGREAWHAAGRGHATSAALVTDDAVYYAERAGEAGPGRVYRLVAA
jgi:outer membrane protein assembly factor BamB